MEINIGTLAYVSEEMARKRKTEQEQDKEKKMPDDDNCEN